MSNTSITLRAVPDDMETQAMELKRHFKQEGARLIREFLERAKTGSDVEDMAALLELAIYRDLLRRYADDDKALERISMEQLLKLDIYYRRARLQARREESRSKDSAAIKKTAARLCVKILAKVEEMSGEEDQEKIRALRAPLLSWAGAEFDRESIEEMERENDGIERLSAAMLNGAGDCGEERAGNGKAVGLAG
ncbi:MAG: hypothetical protein HY751_02985 [Nitrospinae bacterium]|nr:hypothetical protein [Nitrospinota bacterium]